MKSVIINRDDNVCVALEDLSAGEREENVILLEDIPRGHKFAVRDIRCGEDVIKYGSPVGHALKDIKKGEHVHSHNLATNLSGILEYSYEPKEIPVREGIKASFEGYRRADGKVGIRNEIWIIPTVGCVNSVAEILAAETSSGLPEGVDGVFALTHPFGCSQLGGDHKNTQKILAGFVKHPNAGGVLVLGLGCENNNIGEFKKVLGETDGRVRFLNCQDVSDEISEGIRIIEELKNSASTCRREMCGSSELIVGLKCGGSDGLSGITANPVVGVFSDLLVYGGGSTILTEVPEMFGAETRLMERCRNREVFEKTVSMINSFKEYFMKYGQPVYENPSPGNKEGGITTLEDKSLGCTQKCGSAAVTDVLEYGEICRIKGLSLLYAPGNDLVASTALAASGAQLILFTTGRGTPFGCPVPTVKISSNSALAENKKGWIDFDAGTVTADGNIEKRGRELFEYVMRLASGETLTKAEEKGIREISIFRDGVTL